MMRILGMCVALALLAGGVFAWATLPLWYGHPPLSFTATKPPPAPDYSRPDAWAAWPGRNGLDRSVPPRRASPGSLLGTPVDEAAAPADVFYIHPTTYLRNDIWNVPFDAEAPLATAVLENQVSAFNRCCRIYAPQYRQAGLKALKEPRALDLAYGDVVRAFRYYIAHENNGRPFILASHSQGTGHAVRLLQQEIVGTKLQHLLVAAYAIGGYVPDAASADWLPACSDARQTGCIVSWNSGRAGRNGGRIIVTNPTYWWQGGWKNSDPAPAICVNPLTWTKDGAAGLSDNPGSLPMVDTDAVPGSHAIALPDLVVHLTGAVCRRQVLDITVPLFARGFHDSLSVLLGSTHVFDYGLFYEAVAQNAVLRVQAWRDAAATHSSP